MDLANTCTCIFWGKKDLCTICMMGFWNIYAMPHVHNLTKDTYQEIKNFIKKHSPVQYLLAIMISVCPYLVLIFYNFCINSYDRGYR